MNVFTRLITYLLLCSGISVASTNFSIKNLSDIPSYERYEFNASGTTLENTKVIIEYTLVNRGTDSASWIIKGSMPINGLFIEEEYTVRLRDLNVVSSKRKQSFKKGYSETNSEYSVDIKTNDPGEFIISTFQGLMYLLRTFPINSSVKAIDVYMAQQATEKIGIHVRNKGEKSITTPLYGTVSATELHVAVAIPLVGGFLPNVNYYFRNDPARTLVGMKGAFSMTGKKMDVLLVKHIIKK